MNIGSLYSYPNSRIVFSDEQHTKCISSMETDEPFVLLEVKHLKRVEAYKVLTIQGAVGWIRITYPEKVKEVIYDG